MENKKIAFFGELKIGDYFTYHLLGLGETVFIKVGELRAKVYRYDLFNPKKVSEYHIFVYNDLVNIEG